MAARPFDPAHWVGYLFFDVAGHALDPNTFAGDPNVIESQDQNGTWQVVDWSNRISSVQAPNQDAWVPDPATGNPPWVERHYVGGVLTDEARPARPVTTSADMATYLAMLNPSTSQAYLSQLSNQADAATAQANVDKAVAQSAGQQPAGNVLPTGYGIPSGDANSSGGVVTHAPTGAPTLDRSITNAVVAAIAPAGTPDAPPAVVTPAPVNGQVDGTTGNKWLRPLLYLLAAFGLYHAVK